MDYDYYYEDNKSEADEIIDEAVSKLSKLIYDKAKEEITYIQDAYEISRKNYKDAMDKVGQLTQQNILKDREIEKLKNQLESGDKKSLTDLPIAIGDKVWVVERSVDDSVTCPVCNGTRSIERLIEGVKYKADCPKCSYSVPTKERVNYSFSYNFYKIKECEVKKLVVYLEKGTRTIAYWVTDIGWNGSSSQYSEDRVFKFKNDAQDMADKIHRIEKAKAYKEVGREVPDILKPYLNLEVKE